MYLIRRWRGALIAIFLTLALVGTEQRAESYGDTLQVVLPLAGLGCSIATGGAWEYFGRYAVMWGAVHAAKQGVPEPYSLRPSGGALGFPSGHASSSAFGASALVFSCLEDAPLLKTAVVVAAGFTATSRVEVDAHDIWQTFAGVVWAIFCERFLRRRSRLRSRVERLFRRQTGRP